MHIGPKEIARLLELDKVEELRWGGLRLTKGDFIIEIENNHGQLNIEAYKLQKCPLTEEDLG